MAIDGVGFSDGSGGPAQYGCAVVSASELQARVAVSFEGLDLPSWPDPRPDRASPREEEYSRVTDPARYRIVHARAQVWAAVLVNAVGASAERLTPPSAPGDDRFGAFERGVRLVPDRPGALPLVLLERNVATEAGGATYAVLEIGVARPDVVVETHPDCGCDSCDSGSSDLLDAIDATIDAVVGGPYVVLRGKTWLARWHPEGGEVSGKGQGPGFQEVMGLCRRLAEGETVPLPDGTEAFVGRSWLS